MSVAVITGTSNLNPLEVDVAKVAVVELDPRTRHLLEAPIVPTPLRHAGRPALWVSRDEGVEATRSCMSASL